MAKEYKFQEPKERPNSGYVFGYSMNCLAARATEKRRIVEARKDRKRPGLI